MTATDHLFTVVLILIHSLVRTCTFWLVGKFTVSRCTHASMICSHILFLSPKVSPPPPPSLSHTHTHTLSQTPVYISLSLTHTHTHTLWVSLWKGGKKGVGAKVGMQLTVVRVTHTHTRPYTHTRARARNTSPSLSSIRFAYSCLPSCPSEAYRVPPFLMWSYWPDV